MLIMKCTVQSNLVRCKHFFLLMQKTEEEWERRTLTSRGAIDSLVIGRKDPQRVHGSLRRKLVHPFFYPALKVSGRSLGRGRGRRPYQVYGVSAPVRSRLRDGRCRRRCRYRSRRRSDVVDAVDRLAVLERKDGRVVVVGGRQWVLW